MSEVLVSTAVLRERREREREELDRLRALLPEQTVNYAELLLTAWEAAEREAAREYVAVPKAARLTGWSEETLRKYARAMLDGKGLPVEWERLLAIRAGKDYSVCLSSVPPKRTKAA